MFPVIYSEDFLLHDTGRFHPERPERLKAIVQALKAAPIASKLVWQLPTPVQKRSPLDAMQQVHSLKYIESVRLLAENGGGYLDPDTPISARSYDVALLAVNAWEDALEYVLNTGEPAFVLARPPGHHALHSHGMGFCLFSNAAITAYSALQKPGIQRVAILDWDVHHGNGTQALVEKNSQIIYCSLHQSPAYPGTGYPEERGIYNNVLNIPMSPGSTLSEYQQAFEEKVMPFLKNFQPDILIVSAGYDANAVDPLASIELQPSDFGIFTDYCLSLTRRIVFGLEGGYDLKALASSVVATIERCLV